MPQLARAVTAVLLQEPHKAVKVSARTRLLGDKRTYDRIFSRDYPLQTFVTCAKVVRYVEAQAARAPLETDDDEYPMSRNRPRLWWIHWHAAMYMAALAVGSNVTPSSLSTLDFAKIEAIDANQAISQVYQVGKKLKSDLKKSEYQALKTPLSTQKVLDLLRVT